MIGLACRLGVALAAAIPASAFSARFDLPVPPGSGAFGTSVTVLPNGNFVVTDPGYDLPGGVANVGAVYLYSPLGVQISKLTGSSSDDAVGSGRVVVVGDGNFVVCSPEWAYGVGAHDAGAVTWGSGSTGVSGVVSAQNSLVGDKANDFVGQAGTSAGSITVLSNGSYVVGSPQWGNDTVPRAGAVTWGDGNSGVKGIVSPANSMVGSAMNDFIGEYPAIVLKNGNYVVRSPKWDHGAQEDAGAVTWGNGAGGTLGVVGPANSLVGSKTDDQVGFDDGYRGGITPLSNGNYVVWAPFWDNGSLANAGAVTWCSGSTGKVGAIAASNSVIGSAAEDFYTWVTVTELTNGHFVVCLPGWKNGAANDAGAAMWCDGTLGRAGTVSQSNALVGTAANALVGYGEDVVTPLTNGNYVVASNYWHNGTALNAGAVTWCDGSTGRTGTISSSNSLVGTEASTNIGSGGVTALSNGHYVVCSPWVKVSGKGHAGAATWCNGTTGRVGTITAANSLVGAKASDSVGLGGASALPNGNYVVVSYFAYNGNLATAGAVTWCNGASGRTGPISSANSLVGGHADARVGSGAGKDAVTVLANGHYVVRSGIWDNGAINGVGAVTWCDGTTGRSGVVSAANSLVGTGASDQIGSDGIVPLPNGNYVVHSTLWDNGGVTDAGAVTWCSGTGGTVGPVSAANSLVGSSQNDQIGDDGLVVLPNGDYIVRSYLWDNGGVSNAGAVTRGSGSTGIAGIVSAANSLVGLATDDRVGEGPELVASDGAYLFSSPKWNAGAVSNAGAVMLMPPGAVTAGELSAAAGIPGEQATRGTSLSFAYDTSRARAVIGRPYANGVSLFSHAPVFSHPEWFARWAATQGLAGEAAHPEAKPHGDGVPNLLKYAFNLDTASSSTMESGGLSGLPLFTVAGDEETRVFRLEYLRRLDRGLIYKPVFSDRLDGFQPMIGTETVIPVNAEWERVVVEQALGPDPARQLFGRVEVSLP